MKLLLKHDYRGVHSRGESFLNRNSLNILGLGLPKDIEKRESISEVLQHQS
jgi:hypothetical protein